MDCCVKKRRKGEGKRLTDAERLQIIEALEGANPLSMRRIALNFGVGEKTIRNVKKRKTEIKQRVSNSTVSESQKRKRISVLRFPELEKQVYSWICDNEQTGFAVPFNMLQSKALAMAHDMGIREDEFKASNGWLNRFRRRWNMNTELIRGEGDTLEKGLAVRDTSVSLETELKGVLVQLGVIRDTMNSLKQNESVADEMDQCLELCSRLEEKLECAHSRETTKIAISERTLNTTNALDESYPNSC
jgi:Tc5 transposase DNA-binding domain/CENP-B N-terminal DNA-binding domain